MLLKRLGRYFVITVVIILVYRLCAFRSVPSYPTSASRVSQLGSKGLAGDPGTNVTQTYGYVVVVNTIGQQAAGLKSFLSIQCMIGSFNLPMRVVEPFIENSGVHLHLPQPDPDKLLSLHDFYNIAHYNYVSRKQGWAEVVSLKTFEQKVPKTCYLYSCQ